MVVEKYKTLMTLFTRKSGSLKKFFILYVLINILYVSIIGDTQIWQIYIIF